MNRDSIRRCFTVPARTYGWYRITPMSYALLVIERIRLRRSEHRCAKQHGPTAVAHGVLDRMADSDARPSPELQAAVERAQARRNEEAAE